MPPLHSHRLRLLFQFLLPSAGTAASATLCPPTILLAPPAFLSDHTSPPQVYIREEGERPTGFGGAHAKLKRILSFWCFQASVAMQVGRAGEGYEPGKGVRRKRHKGCT